jgi:hypothetical protein
MHGLRTAPTGTDHGGPLPVARKLSQKRLLTGSAGVVVLIAVLRRGARVVLGHVHLPSGAGGPSRNGRLAGLAMPRTRIGTPLGMRKWALELR